MDMVAHVSTVEADSEQYAASGQKSVALGVRLCDTGRACNCCCCDTEALGVEVQSSLGCAIKNIAQLTRHVKEICVFVCMCVCVGVYVSSYRYIRTSVCMCEYIYIYIYTCLYI